MNEKRLCGLRRVPPAQSLPPVPVSGEAAGTVIRRRRSVLRMDASKSLPREAFDGMLAAICYVHGLPAAPALCMFAAGRLAGWLAHALEQQELGMLIRPRAHYTGVAPTD